MKISIALCTYNGEKFLQEQLDSIAEQTLLPGELVACDDQSNDATLEILHRFKDQVSFPVHIHQNETNLGSTKNFEKAISLCQGEIIALCDQDDIWKPHKLERIVETLDANPEAGYVFSDAELVDQSLQPLPATMWESIPFTGELREKFYEGKQFECLLSQCIVTGATMAIRSKVAELVMPFPLCKIWIHDGWSAIVASSIGALGVPISENLIYYRQHPQQQIGTNLSKINKEVISPKTLFEMYKDLKKNRQILYEAWEEQANKKIEIIPILRQKLEIIEIDNKSKYAKKSLNYLKSYEKHLKTRKEILNTKNIKRYRLILLELFSGRYKIFSISWKSAFRDAFL